MPAHADVTAADLQGTWRATVIEGQPTTPGVSMSIAFNADGNGTITTTSRGNTDRVGFTYTLQGNRLTLALADPPGGSIRFRASLQGDTLVLLDLGKRAESRFTR